MKSAEAGYYTALEKIVIGGTYSIRGMPQFSDMPVDDLRLIPAYILDRARAAYDAQQSGQRSDERAALRPARRGAKRTHSKQARGTGVRRSAASGGRGSPAVAPYAWYVLGVLFLVYIVSVVDRQILSILAHDIKRSLEISDAQIGFLYGTAFAVSRVSGFRLDGSRIGGIAFG